MEVFLNSSAIAVNSTVFLKEKITTRSTILNLVELITAIAAIVINFCVIITLTIGIPSFSCRVYFSALLKLSLAHCLLSLMAVAEFIALLLQAEFNVSVASSPNLKFLLIILRNTRVAAFCGLSIPGIASISWINWWILNILINHVDRPTGNGIATAISRVLWFGALVFAFWLNAPALYSTHDMSSNLITETERAISYFLRLYSLVLALSLTVIIFSSFTAIPPVTGHLTSRSVHTKLKCMNHECCDADCVCSDSDVDNTDFRMKDNEKENVLVSQLLFDGVNSTQKNVKNCRQVSPATNELSRSAQSLHTSMFTEKLNKVMSPCPSRLTADWPVAAVVESETIHRNFPDECNRSESCKETGLKLGTPTQPAIVVLSAVDDDQSSTYQTSDIGDSLAIRNGNSCIVLL